MKRRNTPKPLILSFLILALAVPFTIMSAVSAAPPLPGAIFTTDSTCSGTNVNIFSSKGAVYLDGGPAHVGAAGLADGEYYCQVTEPNGTLLGTSLGAADETPIVVTGGEFASCYQLIAILIQASDSLPGYDTTSNPGGEYKVWISSGSDFASSSSKTDNFKVRESEEEIPPQAALAINKFYDANANGVNDPGEQLITGWKVRIQDGIDFIRFTPVVIILDPDEYTITEFAPIETNWVRTTTNPVVIDLADGDDETVEFGNVCLGGGGGHTLGFWSNKNGQATMNDGGTLNPELALLSACNLRNANGTAFDPANYSSFRSWLLSATATNMAYMLSAQMAAMKLNVEAGLVDGTDLVYAPALLPFTPPGISPLGFISINDLVAAADAELFLHGNTTTGPFRAYQEALKNALDAANNNQNFVQGSPCPFTFAD